MAIIGTLASGGLAPLAPTIGTATDGGTGSTVNVAFTAPSWVGKGSGTVTYTATSSPGNITGTSTSSPITVSGLTAGTAYTFTVKATTSYGVTGPSSAASNSVTPSIPAVFDSIATYTANGSTTGVTWSGISSDYKHLQIRYRNPDDQVLYLRINGVTSTTAYAYFDWYFNTGGWAGFQGASQQELGQIRGSIGTLDILDIQNTSKLKMVKMSGGDFNTSSSGLLMFNSGVLMTSSAAITSITLWGTTVTNGAIYSLYGVKG